VAKSLIGDANCGTLLENKGLAGKRVASSGWHATRSRHEPVFFDFALLNRISVIRRTIHSATWRLDRRDDPAYQSPGAQRQPQACPQLAKDALKSRRECQRGRGPAGRQRQRSAQSWSAASRPRGHDRRLLPRSRRSGPRPLRSPTAKSIHMESKARRSPSSTSHRRWRSCSRCRYRRRSPAWKDRLRPQSEIPAASAADPLCFTAGGWQLRGRCAWPEARAATRLPLPARPAEGSRPQS
jgi:hypothetical protein